MDASVTDAVRPPRDGCCTSAVPRWARLRRSGIPPGSTRLVRRPFLAVAPTAAPTAPAFVLPEDTLRRYTRALYPVAFLLMLVPLADLMLRSLPPQFGTLQWRFATAGLLFGNFGTIVLGVALLGLAAALSGDRGMLRAAGVISLVMLVVTFAVAVLFMLDAVQIRRLATANFKRPILTSSLGALFSATFGAVAWLMLGRAALAASRPARGGAAAARGRTSAATPLVAAAGGSPAIGAGAAGATPVNSTVTAAPREAV